MERGGQPDSIGNASVEIKTNYARQLTRQPTSVPGGSGQRAGRDVIATKFRDCMLFVTKPTPAQNIDGAIELARDPKTSGK